MAQSSAVVVTIDGHLAAIEATTVFLDDANSDEDLDQLLARAITECCDERGQ